MSHSEIRYVDLFCGIGGFRYALEQAARKRSMLLNCVFSSDIDSECQKSYQANFGELPHGDITRIYESSIPNHDILLAGFPCQPFSIIGHKKGFEDTRGTLFFDIARILSAKRPKAFVLENVKLLAGHDQGKTLKKILSTLHELGYDTHHRILNALDYGLPQKRERIWIVGFLEPNLFAWPEGSDHRPTLETILESKVPAKFYASKHIQDKRFQALTKTSQPMIWHENKAGHISAHPYSCALRAGASYNYLLVNGERRLTPREMLRLQGFPESFQIVCSDSQTRKQAGNSLPVSVAEAVLYNVLEALDWGSHNARARTLPTQARLLEKPYSHKLNEKSKTKNRPKVSTTLCPK
ncbi:MAG: DNA (cytosine-5-)-methyltransferase [Blastochloris sp.]|nr:DNA (cytosine-5-)-methyltransferase [Blastochloris sp.]